MRHFLALPSPIRTLTKRVKYGSAMGSLVAPTRFTHALAPRLCSTRAIAAVRMSAVTGAADLYQLAAALAAVDPILAGLVHFRFVPPRTGQPNPFTP